jgi:hypothetical protein
MQCTSCKTENPDGLKFATNVALRLKHHAVRTDLRTPAPPNFAANVGFVRNDGIAGDLIKKSNDSLIRIAEALTSEHHPFVAVLFHGAR